MKTKLTICSIILFSAWNRVMAADAGIVIDSSKVANSTPGRGKLTIMIDRVGYPALSAADPKSPFYQDWLAVKTQLEKRGLVTGDEGSDRTTVQLAFSQWSENKPLSAENNRPFLTYRSKISELAGKYSANYRHSHPWDATAFLSGGLREFELQIFCWTLPAYMEAKNNVTLPKFIEDRANSICSNSRVPFEFPLILSHFCEVDEEGVSPECDSVMKDPVRFTPEEKKKVADRIQSDWIESWSASVFEPSGNLSSFTMPMQNYCAEYGSDHAETKGRQELMQFKNTNFLLGAVPVYDTTRPINDVTNRTDWMNIMLGCSERFADIIAFSPEAINRTLAKPRFDKNPWLSSMLYDLAKDYPDELVNEEKIATEVNQKLKAEVYNYANGYSTNQLQPGIEFNRQVIDKILETKAKGAEILLLMLAETETNKNSPWRQEFKAKAEDDQKSYLAVLVKNITKDCPAFGSDTVNDTNCVIGWLNRFNPKQTPRIELKQFGKSTGFVRYGLR